ncbi:MAG: hypothetical protein IRY85_05480 [Micromonosporaceae bacterium]|nr:hypothetical protein [Micromonosporaceae bacterium]
MSAGNSDELDRLAVANKDVVAELASEVINHVRGRAARPCVVVGGFGSGKTHALTAALDYARREVGDGIVVVWVPLGGLGVVSYAGLLYEIVVGLAAAGLADATETARHLWQRQQIKELERLALQELPGSARLVVVIENLDAVVEQLQATDAADWDTLLSKRSGPLIVGSAARPVPGLVPLVLRPLSADEALRLVSEHLRDEPAVITPELDTEVTGYNELVQGNPRFWTLAAGHLAAGRADPLGLAFDEFLHQLDLHFTERLRSLAPGERRIVIELARAGRPLTVTELANLLGVTNQTAMSSIRRLTDKWVKRVDAVPGTDKRLSWYDLRETLLRYHVQRPDRHSSTDLVRHVQQHWYRQAGRDGRGTVPTVDGHLLTESLDELHKRVEKVGTSGHPDTARRLARRLLVERATTNGLTNRATLHALMALGAWTGHIGDKRGGRTILTAALRDAEVLLGENATETLTLMLDLAWINIDLGNYEQAIAAYDAVIARAGQLGKKGLPIVLHARQDRARAIGENGDPAAAVAEFTEVLAARSQHYPKAHRDLRTCRHGLAWWTGKAGDPAGAVSLFDAMVKDRRASVWEKFHYRAAAAHMAGEAAERAAADGVLNPGEAVRRYLDLAEDILRSDHAGSPLARTARSDALKWALRAEPLDPNDLPITAVQAEDFAAMIGDALQAGRLSLADVLALRPSRAQADALAEVLVFARQPRPPRWRIDSARELAPHMSAPKAALILKIGHALDGDRKAESGLPAEWKPILAEIRALDAGTGRPI